MPVTAPSDQVTVPSHPLEVSVKVDGEQPERLAGGVIVGAFGFNFISRPVTAELVSDTHPLTVQVAETE